MSDELLEVAKDLRRYLAWVEPEGKLLTVHGESFGSAQDRLRRAAPESNHQNLGGPRPEPSHPAATAGSAAPQPVQRPSGPSTPVLRTYAQGERVSVPPRALDEIRRELGDCKRCRLCEGRKQIVFGTGNPKAELLFVGEGPGASEDAQGVPFVGEAGDLLTKMIVAMGYSRDEVYICNVVKCRPPGNRNPEPDEIAACEPFLKAQLASIQPKAIVALGKFAAQTLLQETTAITRLRGHWRDYLGVPLMPTFHPAYLLRTPEAKREVWADLQLVMARLGKQVKK